MEFAHRAGAGAILIASTLWLQAGGMTVLIHLARAYIARGKNGLSEWRAAVIMVRFTTFMILLHVSQILLWAAFYRWKCFVSWEPSFYFSACSYSTVGYGDIVLPPAWRNLGPIESIIGVMMCGLSVSALLAIAARFVAYEETSSATAGT